MKTKFLFKASLNSVPLFYPGTAALSEGRGLSLEILKLPAEKTITRKVQIYLSCHTSAPLSGITANPGMETPFPLIKQECGKSPPIPILRV